MYRRSLGFTKVSQPTGPIPEPENHAMLGIGLGWVGYTARRKGIIG